MTDELIEAMNKLAGIEKEILELEQGAQRNGLPVDRSVPPLSDALNRAERARERVSKLLSTLTQEG